MVHISIINVIILILAGGSLLMSSAYCHISNKYQNEKIEHRFNIMESITFALGLSAWAAIGIAYLIPSMNLNITAIFYIIIVFIIEAILFGLP